MYKHPATGKAIVQSEEVILAGPVFSLRKPHKNPSPEYNTSPDTHNWDSKDSTAFET